MASYTVKVSGDQFEISLKNILKEMNETVADKTVPCVRGACRIGVRVTKSLAPMSKGTHSGTYRSGFTYTVKRESRDLVTGTVYNRKMAGLVHLLEKGHARVGGGRVNGKKHLKKGKEAAEAFLINALERELGDLNG